MRIGQAMAILDARYSPRADGIQIMRSPARPLPLSIPAALPLKPVSAVDRQSIGVVLHPLRQADGEAIAARVAGHLALDERTADTLFELLANYWVDDTQFDSSYETIFSHSAVRLLIALGRPLVPFALLRAEEEPERWSYVLARITGVQPIPRDTRREDAASIWNEWLRRNDWI